MDKKNNLIVTIIVIIIVGVMATILIKNSSKKTEPEKVLTQTETELNTAVVSDSTTSINTSLNNIDVTDTSDTDMLPIDQELQNI